MMYDFDKGMTALDGDGIVMSVVDKPLSFSVAMLSSFSTNAATLFCDIRLGLWTNVRRLFSVK